VFHALETIDPAIVHYKVCSTFDSSPELGSIGKAIDIGQNIFDSPFVPVSQGTTSPHGRYVVFGNLFAEKDGTPYRLDRHPTMSTHPRTPMTESDLRRHLGEQTARAVGLIDVRSLTSLDSATAALEATTQQDGNELIVLDAHNETHLRSIGKLLWNKSQQCQRPLFCVGSSGLEHNAFPMYWDELGEIDTATQILKPQETADQILVMSGSAAPATATQINSAEEAGFISIRLDSPSLIDPDHAATERDRVVEQATTQLEAGNSVVLYSVKGPDDAAIKRTRHRFNELEHAVELGDILGEQQGRIVYDILGRTDVDRTCIAGGDTSGAILAELGITALEPIAPTAPGAPLCRTYADEPVADDIEIVFKGGQTGNEQFFKIVEAGGIADEDQPTQ